MNFDCNKSYLETRIFNHDEGKIRLETIYRHATLYYGRNPPASNPDGDYLDIEFPDDISTDEVWSSDLSVELTDPKLKRAVEKIINGFDDENDFGDYLEEELEKIGFHCQFVMSMMAAGTTVSEGD